MDNQFDVSSRIIEIMMRFNKEELTYMAVAIAIATEVEQYANFKAERMYSEQEVINLLETQRGNSYVAVLTATKNDELASIALNAPEPGGIKQFKKK